MRLWSTRPWLARTGRQHGVSSLRVDQQDGLAGDRMDLCQMRKPQLAYLIEMSLSSQDILVQDQPYYDKFILYWDKL